jgi:hypothetical protein
LHVLLTDRGAIGSCWQIQILTKAGVSAKLHFLDDQPHGHSCEQDNQRPKLFPKNHANQRELACHVPFRGRLASELRPCHVAQWHRAMAAYCFSTVQAVECLLTFHAEEWKLWIARSASKTLSAKSPEEW